MVSINNTKCTECGGKIENGTCIYCGNELNADIYKTFDGLGDLNNYYTSIRLKIEKGIALTSEEDKNFYNMLKYKLIPDNELDDLRIMYQILIQNKIISYDTFELLLIRATEKNMRQIASGNIRNYNPQAYIAPDDKCNGRAMKHYVLMLRKELVQKLYEGYFAAMITYYHEICHVKQSIEMELSSFRPELMLMIKDMIIQNFEYRFYQTKNYYEDNYENLPAEIEAEQVGINSTEKLLTSLYLSDNDGVLEERRKAWPGDVHNRNRKVRINDKIEMVDIDDVFLEMINKDPLYIDRYPILKLEFINDNGNIRKRTKEELQELIDVFGSRIDIQGYLSEIMDNLNTYSS